MSAEQNTPGSRNKLRSFQTDHFALDISLSRHFVPLYLFTYCPKDQQPWTSSYLSYPFYTQFTTELHGVKGCWPAVKNPRVTFEYPILPPYPWATSSSISPSPTRKGSSPLSNGAYCQPSASTDSQLFKLLLFLDPQWLNPWMQNPGIEGWLCIYFVLNLHISGTI